jgi:hypothetical protein
MKEGLLQNHQQQGMRWAEKEEVKWIRFSVWLQRKEYVTRRLLG